MYDSVIKIQPYYKDIFIGGEIFKLASYKEREEEIITLHKQHHDNNLPDKKMRYIRLGTFPVTPTTTIDDLKVLCDHIRQEFKIDAFQMAIATKRRREVMQKRLNAVVLHDLGLDVDKEFDEKLLKSYLKENYKHNELVFDQLLDELRHKRLSKKNYSLLKYITVYMKKVCKGELK